MKIITSILKLGALCLFTLSFSGLMAQNTGIGAQSKGEGTQQRKADPTVSLLKKTEIPSEFHTLPKDQPVVITTENGTKISVPANCFVTRSGAPVAGPVKLEVKATATQQDLLLSNLPTQSQGRLLESGGVLYLAASAGGQELELAPGQAIDVVFPQDMPTEGMELFTGEYDAEGNMDWTPVEDGTKPIFKTLDLYGKVNPNTFMFADNKHSLFSYIDDKVGEYAPCCGSDAIYYEVKIRPDGRAEHVKWMTGKSDCFQQTIRDVIQTVEWDVSSAPNGKTIYFEVRTSESCSGETEPEYRAFSGPELGFSEAEYANLKAFYREAELKFLRQERANGISANAFSVTSLGWINCDRFYEVKSARQNIMVNVDNDGDEAEFARAFLVFEDINSVMQASKYPGGELVFANIPQGMDAKIVMVSADLEGTPYIAVSSFNTKNKEKRMTMAATSLTDFQTQIRNLN